MNLGGIMTKKISLIAGSSNKELAKEISAHLDIPLTPIETKKFKDGESYVHVEKSVRGIKIFVFDRIIRLRCIHNPTNISTCQRQSYANSTYY